MERHLDDAALRDLEAKDAPAVAHFREHLSRPCPECEAFLEAAPARLWWLEAEADRLLLLHGAAAAPADTSDTAGFRAVRRAMRARRFRVAGASVAGVAAVAAAVWVVIALPRALERPREWAEVKGPELELLELSAAVVSRDGAVQPIAPGGEARPTDTLVLRYRTNWAGPAFLLRSGAGGPEVLGEVALLAGAHDLQDSGGALGVSLEGERDEVRLFLVRSSAPLTAAGAVEAVRRPPPGRDVRVAAFTVQVVPGGD